MSWADVPVLITGGAGFIGSHLTRALLEQGARVTVLDDLSTGRLGNLPESSLLRWVHGSITDRVCLRDSLEGVRFVFHLAAIASVPVSLREPQRVHEVNGSGTLALLLEAAARGVERVVYSSSSAVYGPHVSLPARESSLPDPVSPYAATKALGEWYARTVADTRGLSTVALRYFNVHGPRQDPLSPYAAAIPLFMDSLLKGNPVKVFGDGLQTRDFIAVEDVVRANLVAAWAPLPPFTRFNIGTGRKMTVLELIHLLGRLMGKEPEIHHLSPRLGDVRHSVADVGAAWEAMAYRAEIPTSEALGQTVRWFMEQGR